MNTAKRNPAEASHEHTWERDPLGAEQEFQSCSGCVRIRRTPGYVAPVLCPPEHAAFADLLAV